MKAAYFRLYFVFKRSLYRWLSVFTADIYDYLDASLEVDGISCECVGGGQIKHDPDDKFIEVFGKSQVTPETRSFILNFFSSVSYILLSCLVIFLF